MNEKIRPEHLQRAAYLYIRQSTAHQVRFHLEGQKRQYQLSQRARELGFTQVVVIDEDLGRSGSGLQARPGFGRLLAAVCQGAAGAVVALEASRLARNNRDWHHLVDLCGLTDTLLIDDDGIYDPKLLNDRLLLGLKGTMSEFELGLFRQRARAAFVQKATKIKDRLLSDSPHLPPERSVGEVSPIPSSSLPRTDGAVITSGSVNARATQEAP